MPKSLFGSDEGGGKGSLERTPKSFFGSGEGGDMGNLEGVPNSFGSGDDPGDGRNRGNLTRLPESCFDTWGEEGV